MALEFLVNGVVWSLPGRCIERIEENIELKATGVECAEIPTLFTPGLA